MPEGASSSPRALIWERIRHASRDSQAGLSWGQIVRAAVSIADAEGLDHVTMRRVASGLGSSAMSLYRHVSNKDDLLDLMLDEVFGEIPLGEDVPGDWRAALRRLACESRTVFKRHPWLSTLLNTRPTLGPNYLRWFEASLAAVAPLGVDPATAARMVGALYAYVGGTVSYELAEEENTRRTGLTEEDKRASVASYLDAVIRGGSHPHFARFVTEGIVLDPEQSFSFGLDCLLQGFAACLPERAEGR